MNIPTSTLTDPNSEIFSVSQLNRRARQLLETHIPLIWVEGELSNLSIPTSGHWYFTLKDEQAQVRCAMFRNRNMGVRFKPQQGQHVLIRARVSLYEGRGDYQVIVEHMEEAGTGALQRAFEQLKHTLSAEGLFDQAHKKAIPSLPKQIAVITSSTGAAIRDILSVLERRFPAIPVSVIPVAVQGKEAAPQIVKAIELANNSNLFDVCILARGGGSIEDLWPFNEELVARAIYASHIPIICGVGHEVDFTIADFVADVRAATPSAAAELCVPDGDAWLEKFIGYELLLEEAITRKLQQAQQKLTWLTQRLRHPKQALQQQSQRLDLLELRLHSQIKRLLERNQQRLRQLELRLQSQHPKLQINRFKQHWQNLSERLKRAQLQALHQKKQQFQETIRILNTLSPLNTLERGYALVTDPSTKQVIQSTKQLSPGQILHTNLADGEFNCRVETITK